MARGVAQSGKVAGSDKLKVFISYSRRDAAAADAIVAALEARGFEVKIDRRNLPFGEEWQKELAEFIRLSDTVIWLVSEASITSEWVNWELDEVKARNKRLVPLMVGLVNPAALPRQLGAIHILPPDRVFDLARDLDTLVEVLETDHAWLKQATRWQDRAAVWIANKRGSGRLLSRSELKDAERWKDTRPAKAPAPAPEVMELLLASRQAATRRQRWWIGGSLTAALFAIALAGFAWWQRDQAVEQRGVAETRQRETDKLRKETQVTESGLLAKTAEDALKLPGDSGAPLAMLLALEGMRDEASNDARQVSRERVPETQFQLDGAYRGNRERAVLAHENSVHAVAWSPDGTRLATGSQDKSARIVEAATGREIARVAHEDDVNAVAWAPAGAAIGPAILTGSADRTARLWRVFPTAQALVNAAKERAARCLTQAQRAQYFLPPAPPTWCVERRLWPYHTDAWHNDWLPKQKAWLASGRQGDPPPLPKTEPGLEAERVPKGAPDQDVQPAQKAEPPQKVKPAPKPAAK
jgi:hypothetical protein